MGIGPQQACSGHLREPLLGVSPIYRQFLAGGPEQFRLPPGSAAWLLGGGVVLLAVQLVIAAAAGSADWATPLCRAATATLTALLTAALASRWLGRRVGGLAGLIYLSSLHVIASPWLHAADLPLSAAVTVAIGAFALANVPGRLPPLDLRRTRLAFYAAAGIATLLAGAIGPALIFSACLAYLLSVQDRRSVRFLADPWAIGLFLLLVAPRLMLPTWQNVWGQSPGFTSGMATTWALRPEILGLLGAAALPWTPLALLAVAAGVHQGHDATPVWRLFGCWILAPLMLGIAGALGEMPPLGTLLPPLAILAASGLCGTVWWWRKKGTKG
jgi:4-amino-4-deoxy-L-arabinose transferase-like glycosyltransferase